jgi:dienelactone hydrolase
MAEILPLVANAAGRLRIPRDAQAIVLLAQNGAGDDVITDALHQARFATLPIPLDGGDLPSNSAKVRRLTDQLVATAEWVASRRDLASMQMGLFGAELAGGAALAAAAIRPDVFRALVLRDGRPDLAGSAPTDVRASTLLIVNGHDHGSVAVNQETMSRVKGIAELEILSEADLAPDDPDAIGHIAELARRWFDRFLS